MVMMNPQLVLWTEDVIAPSDPAKTVHVRNHFRRPWGTVKKKRSETQPRITPSEQKIVELN